MKPFACGVILVASMISVALDSAGCSSYGLTRITAAEAESDLPDGATYRVAPPNAFLVHTQWTGAVGVGQPRWELTRWDTPETSYKIPAGTRVTIEQYVRFDQHGLYDCGFDGWRFAVGSVLESEHRGTRFLIRPSELKSGNRDEAVLELPEQPVPDETEGTSPSPNQ